MHRWLTLISLIPLLFLQSCIIEGEEEIWIESNGSGKIRVEYTLPSLAVKSLGDPTDYIRAIEEVAAAEKGITIQTLVFEAVGKKSLFGGRSFKFLLEASLEDITGFTAVADKHKADFVDQTGADPDHLNCIAGKINFDFDLLSPSFQRSVTLGNLMPGMLKRSPAALGRSNFRYILHLPVSVKESNAHRTSPDEKTVEWRFLLKEYVNKPLVMRVTAKPIIPWWAWVILAVLTLGILKFILSHLRWTKKAAPRSGMLL